MAIWCCAHGTIEGKIDCVQSFALETISFMQTCVTNAHCHRQLKPPSVSKPWLNVRQDRKRGKNWESEKEKEAPHSGFQLKPLLITEHGFKCMKLQFSRNITRNPNFREITCSKPPTKP